MACSILVVIPMSIFLQLALLIYVKQTTVFLVANILDGTCLPILFIDDAIETFVCLSLFACFLRILILISANMIQFFVYWMLKLNILDFFFYQGQVFNNLITFDLVSAYFFVHVSDQFGLVLQLFIQDFDLLL